MAQCKNCRTKLGCSCKRRTASDGTSCCATCLSRYEINLKKNSTTKSNPTGDNSVVILNATAVQKK